ncbi:hypothetical protein C2845_PM06G23050 [Panicum miliaceum]|uniref:B3 domain-containing protein n=1 Tax=Panicum miliaceum TaxID=4540 RepID=A0A3L6RDM1_PANMI|nr:hypothetical protein C2845_PM06G23050 [Panicum miliaceum]
MVVYDPAAASQQRDAKRARRPSADAGAVVPYDVQPIDAVPLKAIAPRLPRLAPAPAVPEEPPCLRRHILSALGLRDDLPVHFIDRKRVTGTDLDAHQNRPRRRPEPDELENVAAGDDSDAEHQEQGQTARKKRQGRRHGGLPVRLVDLAAGASGELLLSRWESTGGTVVKGEGYMGFVRRCSFREDDAVEIWAFKQRAVRLFGAAVCDESHLHDASSHR